MIRLIIFLIGLSLVIGIPIKKMFINQEYNQEIHNYWVMADRSSLIQDKSEYIDKYVDALEKSNLEGNNANIFLETPTESFDENFKSLKTLQERLHEIKNLDPESFQYNTAINQITSQEQGEASQMNNVIERCWMQENHYLFYIHLMKVLFVVGILMVFGVFISLQS